MSTRTVGRTTRRKLALSVAALALAAVPATVTSLGSFDPHHDALTTSVLAPQPGRPLGG